MKALRKPKRVVAIHWRKSLVSDIVDDDDIYAGGRYLTNRSSYLVEDSSSSYLIQKPSSESYKRSTESGLSHHDAAEIDRILARHLGSSYKSTTEKTDYDSAPVIGQDHAAFKNGGKEVYDKDVTASAPDISPIPDAPKQGEVIEGSGPFVTSDQVVISQQKGQEEKYAVPEKDENNLSTTAKENEEKLANDGIKPTQDGNVKALTEQIVNGGSDASTPRSQPSSGRNPSSHSSTSSSSASRSSSQSSVTTPTHSKVSVEASNTTTPTSHRSSVSHSSAPASEQAFGGASNASTPRSHRSQASNPASSHHSASAPISGKVEDTAQVLGEGSSLPLSKSGSNLATPTSHCSVASAGVAESLPLASNNHSVTSLTSTGNGEMLEKVFGDGNARTASSELVWNSQQLKGAPHLSTVSLEYNTGENYTEHDYTRSEDDLGGAHKERICNSPTKVNGAALEQKTSDGKHSEATITSSSSSYYDTYQPSASGDLKVDEIDEERSPQEYGIMDEKAAEENQVRV